MTHLGERRDPRRRARAACRERGRSAATNGRHLGASAAQRRSLRSLRAARSGLCGGAWGAAPASGAWRSGGACGSLRATRSGLCRGAWGGSPRQRSVAQRRSLRSLRATRAACAGVRGAAAPASGAWRSRESVQAARAWFPLMDSSAPLLILDTDIIFRRVFAAHERMSAKELQNQRDCVSNIRW